MAQIGRVEGEAQQMTEPDEMNGQQTRGDVRGVGSEVRGEANE
jgi:hypothetical protein